MAKKKGKGNNTAGRKKITSYRIYKDEVARPVLYCGKHAGHGTYMAGETSSGLVTDSNGVPLQYSKIKSA